MRHVQLPSGRPGVFIKLIAKTQHILHRNDADDAGGDHLADGGEDGHRLGDHVGRVLEDLAHAVPDQYRIGGNGEERQQEQHREEEQGGESPQMVAQLEPEDGPEHGAMPPPGRRPDGSRRPPGSARPGEPVAGGLSLYTCTTGAPATSRVEITSCTRMVSANASRATALRQTRPRSSPMTWAGSPVSTTRPRSMIAMRLQSSLTSSTMWVERITITSLPISPRRLRKRRRSVGSSPAVGSSTMMSRGTPDQCDRDASRCFIPPENPPTVFLRGSHRLV